jgi:glycosyltransferase involved in cell wall biosynthesis
MNQPLISVVIPAYNAQKYITEAISSVWAQKYSAIEIIVVNDGSTDQTLAKLQQEKNIQIISQENKGQAAARNAGILRAKGSLIALFDADDVWMPNHISLMLPYLIDESGYDFVRGMIVHARNIGAPDQQFSIPMFMDPLVGACLYKKSVFDNIGLFDEQMRQGEDFDWNIRLSEAGCKEKRIEQPVLFYRRHETNLTNEESFRSGGQARALQKKIIRMKNRLTPHL